MAATSAATCPTSTTTRWGSTGRSTRASPSTPTSSVARCCDTIQLDARATDFPFCTQQSTAPGPPVCAPGATTVASLPELQSTEGDLDLWLGAAGLRFNPTGNLLISANALFSLGDEGLLDEDVIPVVSIEYSF